MCGGEGGYLHDECEDKNFSVQKEMYLEFHSSPVVSVDQTSQVFTKCTVGCDKKIHLYYKKSVCVCVGGGGGL